jgi:hypothetical protein
MKTHTILSLITATLLSGLSLQAQFNPFGDTVADAQGWKRSEWYGWINDARFPWLYAPDHGWQMAGPGNLDGFWLWDGDLGWFWTSPEQYPTLFARDRNTWLSFLENTERERIFHDLAHDLDLAYEQVPGRNVPRRNGFRLQNPQIPVPEIISGGPPRDGIPAILDPVFVSQAEADAFMEPDDIVLSVTHNGTTRAYPFRILNWHEVVNDQIDNFLFAATYCPLCGTAMVFDRVVNGRELTFGVSGLLYRDNVLMYDHQTESLWNQLALQAQTGTLFKTPLRWIPSQQLRYSRWKERFPDGAVLSTETGFNRDYSRDPYTWVPNTDSTLSGVTDIRDDLPVKAWVFGILINGKAMAFPLEVLQQGSSFETVFQGVPLSVSYDPSASELTVTRTDTGDTVPAVQSFWFAWQGFYPQTAVFSPTS